MSKNNMLLLVTGLAIMAVAQLVSHFFKLSDVMIGFSMRVGIGFLLLAVIKMRRSF